MMASERWSFIIVAILLLRFGVKHIDHASQMQEYGGVSSKSNEYRDTADIRDRAHQDGYQNQQYSVISQKSYGCSNKELSDQNVTAYCRVTTGVYESTSNQQYHNPRYINPSAPTFSSPPNSPLVGLVFDPSSPNFSGHGVMADRLSADRRSQSPWSISNQEPIGTGARKKIVKSHDKRNAYSADPRYHERYKDNTETDRQRKQDRNLNSESTSSLDFFAEGERMVSELCNISESNPRNEANNQKQNQKTIVLDDDKNKASGSSDLLLTALDKIIIHDQIPNQIVQLAIEACTDAENIAIAHHNRPCFKNIHSICAKTRSNVQKSDSAVANLHSQGIPWVIKNFIFSFVRILDGWKGVKELLSEKHDTFSRIENKYYSPNIRDCFVQWQAVTKEMLTHIYKTFKCLDHGFTLEQKSFTHNYYATNPTGPRHQNQNKFQPVKPHIGTPRTISATPQPYNAMQPPWVQNQSPAAPQSFSESQWPSRSGVTYKKFPVVPPSNPHNFYPLSDQNELEHYQKIPYKCEPCSIREAKPRQSWTITNVPDFRALENMCHADQRELYNQLKHKMDAELGKAPGQPVLGSMPCELLQRREMELKAKMIPLSHVEKALIPSMATAAEIRGCLQKNNSCGDTKEETDFFATWGQVIQKEPNDFLTHHTHNIPVPSNVVTISNISGPVQFIEPDNDEFHEMSKVYMKPGSYKVPIKPTDPVSPFLQPTSQDTAYDTSIDDTTHLKIKTSFPQVTLAPQPKYNIESWPCLMSRRNDEVFGENQKAFQRVGMSQMDVKVFESLDLFGSITSDNAWEAAKQSAPKLMDFIHEGSKSDTARLYDALCLSTTDEISETMKTIHPIIEHNDGWCTSSLNNCSGKQSIDLWHDELTTQQDLTQTDGLERPNYSDDISKLEDCTNKFDIDDQTGDNKQEEYKESTRFYDQTGNLIKDDNLKKPNKSKTVSGMWYHPKKKKPLPAAIVKKFEALLSGMYQINEAKFIMDDMDIKMAPRFYEVVKRPMCLHDISTKLKNSTYTEHEQVVQDFRRIFNNVRLYLKAFPDPTMKRNVNKISMEFEKMLNDEFQNKTEPKTNTQDTVSKKHDKDADRQKSEWKNEDTNRKIDSKQIDDGKK